MLAIIVEPEGEIFYNLLDLEVIMTPIYKF